VVSYVTNQMFEPGSDNAIRGLEVVMAAYDGLTGPPT
jgi:hypothetical protein